MEYIDKVKCFWDQSQHSFPNDLPRFSKKDQKSRERHFDNFLSGIQEIGLFNENKKEGNMHELLKSFFKDTLHYTEENLSVILSNEMIESTYWFINAARVYDPEMSFHDIFQACRNVWIMNGLQFIFEKPIELTPPIFAYSMLYPYTDNYIDDPAISTQEKVGFSNRFADRIKGKPVKTNDPQEEKIFHMIEIIEDFWNRDIYPEVYDSLLGIHRAQTQSLALLHQAEHLSSDDVFRICVQKGGTSVVADGYLILGNLTEEEKNFLFCYGAYLQLLDDLQDLSDDLKNRLMTCFSMQAGKEEIDEWFCKTYHLGKKVMEQVDSLETKNTAQFKLLMKKSIDLFLIEAITTNSSFFTQKFVEEFETYSPLRFSFIRKRSSTFSPYQDQLFNQIMKQAIIGRDKFSYDFLNRKQPAE